MQQVAPQIYYEDLYYGVVLGAILLPLGTILIDAPLRAEDVRAWRIALSGLKGSHHRILVNLDAHPDRALGARAMECTIVAHHKTAQVFRNRPSFIKTQSAESGADWEMNNEVVSTRWVSPDITFTHDLVFHLGGPEVVLEYHPGPSPGATWVIIPSQRVIFVGDAVMQDQPPFLAFADLHAWLESLQLLINSYREYLIISGRSGPVTIEAARAHLQFLRTVLKGTERLAKRNAPPEATEALVPKLLEHFPSPPDRLELYAQRLRHGIYQYYAQRYKPSENPDKE
jgi:glyoxylase-like metal-dependent hydrolase (beta-lactamase superfamily II)